MYEAQERAQDTYGLPELEGGLPRLEDAPHALELFSVPTCVDVLTLRLCPNEHLWSPGLGHDGLIQLVQACYLLTPVHRSTVC